MPKLTSGFYLLNQKIPLLVKTPALQAADIVIVYPSNTEAAYNGAGGKSMYSQPIAAPIVSFHRPTPLSRFCKPFLEWMASIDLPYRVRYIADIDMDDYAEISDAKVVVAIGHSEYWTRRARENFDRFVLAGGNALILSGNSMWWQVRYSEDRQKILCYKKEALDPISDPLMRTINWNNSTLKFTIHTSIGVDFPRGGYGSEKDKGNDGFSVLQPNSPVFAGLGVKKGDIISLPTHEYDGAPLLNSPVDNGTPQLDIVKLGAHRAEIIGYDYGFRVFVTVGTWMVMQRTPTSGTIINGASTDWCSVNGVGGKDGEIIKKLSLTCSTY